MKIIVLSEEKNQKTFIPQLAPTSRPWPPGGEMQRNKGLLLLFFRKEYLFPNTVLERHRPVIHGLQHFEYPDAIGE
jgi:hypothetical protein